MMMVPFRLNLGFTERAGNQRTLLSSTSNLKGDRSRAPPVRRPVSFLVFGRSGDALRSATLPARQPNVGGGFEARRKLVCLCEHDTCASFSLSLVDYLCYPHQDHAVFAPDFAVCGTRRERPGSVFSFGFDLSSQPTS